MEKFRTKDIMLTMFTEICNEENIKMDYFGGDVLVKLTKDERIQYIYSYTFSLNTSSSSKLCDNKRLASAVMSSEDINTAEHITFKYEKKDICFSENSKLIEYLKLNNKLVCKYNDGGGGKDIFLISSVEDLKNLPRRLFKSKRRIVFSPFYKFEDEYRVVVLKGKVKLIFNKVRRYLKGDGVSSISELLNEMNVEEENYNNDFPLSYIIEKEEKILINWQHNLSTGAIPRIVKDKELSSDVSNFVLNVARKLNVTFASIDVANTSRGLMVIEVNAGVTMNRFSIANDEHSKIAKSIYRDAILEGFKDCL